MADFEQLLQPQADDILLDVGGYPRTWTGRPQLVKRIDCINIHPESWNEDVHWFPVRIRRRLLKWFTPWGWSCKPTQEKIDETIAYTRLLTKRQMKKLFPDCVIVTERLLWVFPKSYVAYRTNCEEVSQC